MDEGEHWLELRAEYRPRYPKDWGQRIVREFWWRAFDIVDEAGLAKDFPTLDGVANFHGRFFSDGSHLELFRLKVVDQDSDVLAAIKAALLLSAVVSNSAQWVPWSPAPRSNQFLTFVEACTVLRVQRGISHEDFLAGETREEWARAYLEMRMLGRPWSEDLRPWVRHLDAMIGQPVEGEDALEYGHWFGHIMSDRSLGV
jgi:hypothetical protein